MYITVKKGDMSATIYLSSLVVSLGDGGGDLVQPELESEGIAAV